MAGLFTDGTKFTDLSTFTDVPSDAVASAAGTSAISGIGAAERRAVGNAAGVATVLGASPLPIPGDPILTDPIHANLVMFVGSHPAAASQLGTERIAQNALTLFGAATLTTDHPDIGWKALRTQGGSSGAWAPLSNQFKTITGNFTLWFDLIFNTTATSSHVLCVPWDATTFWQAPFTAFDYLRATTTTSARWQFTPVGTLIPYIGTLANSWPTALARKRLWLRRSGTTLTLGAGSTTIETITVSSAAPNWAGVTGVAKIVFGHRKPENTTAEGFGATFLRAMAWNRALSDVELATLEANPLYALYGIGVTAAEAVGNAGGQSTVTGLTPSATVLAFGAGSGLWGGSAYGESSLGESPFTIQTTGVFAVGAAAGEGVAVGQGATIASAVASATGNAVISGTGGTFSRAIGNAAGSSTVTGPTAVAGSGTASAAGVAIANGVAASITATVGNAAGTSSVAAFTGVQATGSAVGTADVVGFIGFTVASTGQAAGVATASAEGAFDITIGAVGASAGVAVAAARSGTLRKAAIARGAIVSAGMRNWTVFTGTPGLQQLVAEQYNGLTPGNAFKWVNTEPTQGNFDFTEADLFVNWADARSLPVRVVPLVWHNSLPAWVAPAVNPGTWQGIIDTHIDGVLGHYVGRSWDVEVVNEAFRLSDSLPGGYRDTLWYQAAGGPAYIPYAFQRARFYAPTARLFLADFDIEQAGEDAKRAAILAALQGWLGAGVPIDGLSIQGHLQPAIALDKPAFTAFLRAIKALGLDIVISEFDFRDIAALGVGDAAAFAAIGTYTRDFLDIALAEGADTVTTWGVAPEDWAATGSEQIAAVPFGASPTYATTPIYKGILQALEGLTARSVGQTTTTFLSALGVTSGQAAGTATVTGRGATFTRAVGTATGSATVTGTEAILAAAAGQATGVAGVTGAGAGIKTTTASAAGVGAAIGQPSSAASAAGLATAQAIGAAIKVASGQASGVATASGVGARAISAVAQASGAATVIGIVEAGVAVAGAVGQADVVGIGGATNAITAASAGQATADGFAAAIVAADGNASGSAGGLWISEPGTTTGTAAGTATVSGAGGASIALIAAAVGTSAVNGTGGAIVSAVGTAAGVASLTIVTDSARGVGSAQGTATVLGTTLAQTGASAQAQGLSAVDGRTASLSQTVASAAGTSTVSSETEPAPYVELSGMIWQPQYEMTPQVFGTRELTGVKWPRAA
jgi:endo-1,4-beta-xylanase